MTEYKLNIPSLKVNPTGTTADLTVKLTSDNAEFTIHKASNTAGDGTIIFKKRLKTIETNTALDPEIVDNNSFLTKKYLENLHAGNVADCAVIEYVSGTDCGIAYVASKVHNVEITSSTVANTLNLFYEQGDKPFVSDTGTLAALYGANVKILHFEN